MARIYFNATEDQILTAAALAANHAIPAGLGFMHYKPDKIYTPDDMKAYLVKDGTDFINCDYVDGRCTKFAVWQRQDWQEVPTEYAYITAYETQPTYETWFTKFPTYLELLKAAGITDLVVGGTR